MFVIYITDMVLMFYRCAHDACLSRLASLMFKRMHPSTYCLIVNLIYTYLLFG